ncbi:hypothetical protein DPMN_027493 [Dreissena polymorpha]|uniref:Uncharacterized protein n=1 Tax=Dreissena polymorpha TaxID=45954 RepID=A0A9D4LUG3_DREPO|nr:hypothetical protein DPMN_027493 [Dreissena polymorpha]
MNHHLFTEFRIGQSNHSLCKTGSMTTEHSLQFCPLQDLVEKPTRQAELYGSLQRANVSI